MPNLWRDWRLLVAAYVLVFGLWGFLAKLASSHLRWTQQTFLIVGTNFAVVAAATFPRLGPWTQWSWVALLAGIFGALGSLTFYRVLAIAPATIVLPLSSLYVAVTTILAMVFLHETLTIRKLAGIACSLAAVMLLTGDATR